MNGRWTASSASRRATLVWVRPPALTMATSKSRWWSRSMSAPSWFDWKKATVEPELGRADGDPGVDLVERSRARRSPVRVCPTQVEVRALEDEDGRHRALPVVAGQQTGGGSLDDRRVDVVANDDPVGGRQDPAQSPGRVLLVGREVVQDRRERVGQGLARQAERVEQALDPRRALRWRDLDLDPDPRRRAKPVGDRLTVEQPAVAGRRLEGVTQRMAEIERDPPAGRPAFAFIGDRRPPPWPSRRARRARRRRLTRTPPGRRGRSPGPSVSSRSNSRSSPRAAILTASPSAARSWRSGRVRRASTSMMTADGWWKAPTRFLPSGRSTPVLPPIAESIWATSVVGTWMNRIPRR